ncbi:MAG: hypothetical protein CL596_05750 [Alteromonas sp.]|nr:hypothetical protein [Alteromonas sp.]
MNLWARVKRLSFPTLVRFGFLLIQKPLLIYPIWKATKRTMIVSQELYGNAHQGNGKANAFRHAFWNVKICQNCLKFTKNESKSAIWTQKVTDLYEKVTRNETLDREMDLHNNAIGRAHFLQNLEENESESIDFIQKMTKNAQKVAKVDEIKNFENVLVYISE